MFEKFNWVGFENGNVAFNPKTIDEAEAFMKECASRNLNPSFGTTHTSLKFLWYKNEEDTLYVYTKGRLTFFDALRQTDTEEGISEIFTVS